MNALVNIGQVDVKDWFFDSESVQTESTICLQKSLDDYESFVVIDTHTNKILQANDSWMIGLFAFPTDEQMEAYNEGLAA